VSVRHREAILRIITLSALAASLSLSAGPLLADSLCEKDETTYFSCKINNSKKIASLCGRYPTNVFDLDILEQDAFIEQRAFLTYRFGTKQRIELEYPEKRKNSLKKFEGVALHSHYGDIHEVYFSSGNYSYSVSSGDGEDGSENGINIFFKGSIDVVPIKQFRCQRGATSYPLWELTNILINFGGTVVKHP
jgi:hypothetical protein